MLAIDQDCCLKRASIALWYLLKVRCVIFEGDYFSARGLLLERLELARREGCLLIVTDGLLRWHDRPELARLMIHLESLLSW